MNNLISQFKQLEIAKFRIILQAQSEAVLPALIGSTLRGAFGYALKAISCCVPHKNCQICFLSTACLYTSVFEPTSQKVKDLPRPFIFEPPIPPFTKEVSENSNLKLRVNKGGKISFDFVLLGETIKKLPYFIYAFDLLAQHGLGVERQSFQIGEVFVMDENSCLTKIYSPNESKISLFQNFDLGFYVQNKINENPSPDSLKIQLQTPLRIRRDKELLENISFSEFFKQCSIRVKFLFESYSQSIVYDHLTLMKQAESIEKLKDGLWRHNFTRHTNRQGKKLNLDGMLGEIEFAGKDLAKFLPFIIVGSLLHIGSASSLGLGKYKISSV